MIYRKDTIMAFVLICVLIVGASWLYMISRVDYAAHHERVEVVNKLQQQTDKLANDVLLVESGGVSNFDQVAQTEVVINELLSLQSDAEKHGKLEVEIKRFLSTVAKIKSSHAVYLNSVAYFPKSVSLLRGMLLDNREAAGLLELNSLERQAVMYSLMRTNQTPSSKEKITQQVVLLQQVLKSQDQGVSDLMAVVVRHSYVLMRYSEKLNELNGRLLNNQIADKSQDIVNRYNDDFNASLVTAKNIRSLFYGAVFALILLSFSLWNRQKKSMQQLSENTRNLTLALEISKQNQFSVDVEKSLITLGKSYSKALGLGSKEYVLTIEDWERGLHPDDKDKVATLFHSCLTTGVDFQIDYRWKARNKSWLWVSSVGRIVETDAKGKPLKMAGISANITERKMNEHVLRVIAESNPAGQSEENVLGTIVKELAQAQGMKYALIARVNEINPHMVDTVAVWTGDGFADNFSYALDGTPCQNILKEGACLYPHSVQELFPEDLILVDMGAVSYMGVPLKNSHKRVVGLLAVLDVEPMSEGGRMESLMMSLATRVSMEIERKDAKQQLQQLAHYDVLTGLPNRSLLTDRFRQAEGHGQRGDSLLAVCFLDLDNFKPVNDKHGHAVGDLLLKEVANRLLDSIRKGDTVSRLGGDEFVLLLGEISSIEECELSLDRILQALSMPFELLGGNLNISASVGYSLVEGTDNELDALIRQADQAMYIAKTKGKNRYSRFDKALGHRAVKKQTALSEIRSALLANNFRLYYQPKINMRTGNVYGAEALIRWIHPEKGLIPPLDFLPMIEGNKLEIQVGDWVISNAVQQMDVWRQAGIELEVSINISSYHLLSKNFLQVLEQVWQPILALTLLVCS